VFGANFVAGVVCSLKACAQWTQNCALCLSIAHFSASKSPSLFIPMIFKTALNQNSKNLLNMPREDCLRITRQGQELSISMPSALSFLTPQF
jgi:hypothetical protein